MKTLFIFAFLTFAPMLLATDLPESNVLGEECPELLLEEKMIQGEIKPLANRVSFFLFYQRESEGCESIAMPRVQKLFEKYAGGNCWQVFVINTAFDKDAYPYLADATETGKHLQRMGWTMPVARDLDEKSNGLFTLDEISGVPQVVVVDETGVVRAHEWYSSVEEMDRVDAIFKNLAAGMNCHCVRMPRKVGELCGRAYKAIKDGEYSKAWKDADLICSKMGYDDKDKADAEYLKQFIEGVVEIRVERQRRKFEFDPETALSTRETVLEEMKPFEDVPGATEFVEEVKNWDESPDLQLFRDVQKKLSDVEKTLAKEDLKGADRDALDEKLQAKLADELVAIAEKVRGTALAKRIDDKLKAIGAEDRILSSDKLKAVTKDDQTKSGVDDKTGATDGSKPSDADSHPEDSDKKPAGVKAKARPNKPADSADKPAKKIGSESSRHRTVRSR